MPWIVPVIQILVIVASTAYQIVAAHQRGSAGNRNPGGGGSNGTAEARKGFEMVIEGGSEYIPKIYGRAKVGGVRVYHNTSGGYKHVATNADDVFETGSNIASGTYNRIKRGLDGILYFEPKTYFAQETGRLSQTITDGSKNEFLFYQQALCQGPIYDIIDIIIDESRYFDDPALGDYMVRNEITMYTDSVKSTEIEWKNTTAAMRVNCYRSGGVADNIITANFNDRQDATFNGIAYASAIVRLDRDDPQFSGIPNLQFLIEGSLVKKVVGGVLSTTAGYVDDLGVVYGNNPAWCLLDYLMDKKSGQGVPESEIDLGSFETVAATCAQIVQTNAIVGGKIYQSTDTTRNTTLRNIPLYECNIIIDTKKTTRDNIEAILATMGDARLIWSGGKYKLSLQYVTANNLLDTAMTITDDDLVLDQTVSINWPSSSQRLNFATVRFHNESEQFKEDAVSWPPKVTVNYKRGVGGTRYAQAITGQNNDTVGGALLNDYGVWKGGDIATLYYQFVIPKGVASAYTLKHTADKSMTIVVKDVITNAILYSGSSSGTTLTTYTFLSGVLGNATVDKVYSVDIVATEGSPQKGAAASLETSSNIVWTTRSLAYSSFMDVSVDSAIYDSMLSADSGLKLEMDLFADGITDYYHALAKAEELVKTSRSAFAISFKYIVKSIYLEPGDYVKLQSDAIYLGSLDNPLYLRIDSVKMSQDNSCEIAASRFDYTQLAWSSKLAQYILPPNLYSSKIVGPAWVEYTPRVDSLGYSSGTLNWAAVNHVDTYIICMHTSDGIIGPDGVPQFTEIGRVPKKVTYFNLPLLNSDSAFFGVKAAVGNLLSTMTYTSTSLPILLGNYTYTHSGLKFTYNSPLINQISWVDFTMVINGSTEKDVSGGNATYIDKKIYLYYDPITNLVKSTTSLNIANSGKLLAEYSGGSNGSTLSSNLLPPINLYVINTTAGAYATKDLEITWDYSPANDSKTDLLKNYYLQILNGTTVVHSETVEYIPVKRGGYFKISYNLNKGWFLTAKRDYNIKVYSVDTSGSLSSAAILAVNNSVPPIQSLATPINGISTIYLRVTTAQEADTAGYQVYRSLISGFTPPLEGTLVYDGAEQYITLDVPDTKKYYYKVASYDTFDKLDLIFSSEYTGTALGIDAVTWSIADGIVFTADSILKKISWTSGHILKGGETVSRAIDAGSATWTAGFVYVYYNENISLTVIQSSTSLANAVAISCYPLATYTGGDATTIKGGTGDAFISGSQLIAGTVGASQIIAGSITGSQLSVATAVITDEVQVASAVITNAAIKDYIQSTNYSNVSHNGWKLDKAGNITTYGTLSILDSSGRVVLSSGSTPQLDFDYVGGTTAPDANATRNVFKGNWTINTNYDSGDIVLDTWGYGWSCKVTHVSGETTTTGIIVPIYTTGSANSNTNWTLYIVKGNDAISVILSNDIHVFPATSSGVVSNYTGSNTDIRAYDGAREIIYDGLGASNGTWNVSAVGTNIAVSTKVDSGDFVTYPDMSSGVSSTIDASKIVYTITGKSYNGTAFTINTQQSFAKSKAGAPGTSSASAAAFAISNAGSVLTKDAAGAVQPSAGISLTTYSQNISSTSWQWYKDGGIISGAITGSYTVPTSDYTSTFAHTYKCIITGTVGALTSQTLEDSITIPLVVSGTSSPVVILSNESSNFPAPATGFLNINYAGGGCDVTAYIGTTKLAYNTTGPNTFSCTNETVSGCTVAAGEGSSYTYSVVAPALTSNKAYNDVITTIRDGSGTALSTITKRINYSLSRAGDTGTDSSSYALRLSSSVISKSVLNVLTPPSSTASIYKTTGTASPALYAGRFIIATSLNGTTYTDVYNSNTLSTNESSKAYTIPVTAKTIRVRAYLINGTTLLDEEIITIVTDGSSGIDSVNNIIATLANGNQTLPADSAGNAGTFSAVATMSVYNGAVDDSANWTYTKVDSNANSTITGAVVTATSFAAGQDTGTVTITATRSAAAQVNILSGSETFDEGEGWTTIPATYGTISTTSDIAAPNGTYTAKRITNYTTTDCFYRFVASFPAQTYSFGVYIYVPAQGTVKYWSLDSSLGNSYAGNSLDYYVFDKWVFVEVSCTSALAKSFLDFNILFDGVASIAANVFHVWGAMGKKGVASGKYLPHLAPVSTVFTLSKARAGVAGTSATYVTVTGEQAFKFATGSATPTSTSITLTAALTGGLTAYQWGYWNGTAWTTLSGTVNTSTYALVYNNAAFTANSLRVRCISGTAFDEITIVKLYDGATGVSAVSGYLTNETVAVATTSGGTGAVYTSAGGTFKVFNGITDVTTSTAFTTTAAVSGLTLTIGANTGIYSVAGTWTSDIASFTLTGVYSGTTITKVYKITKAKAGVAGGPGAAGDSVDIVFKRGLNLTAAPTTPAPSTSPPAGGWSSLVADVAAGVNPMWSMTGFQTASTGNYTWQAPVKIEGANVAEVTIFTRTGSPAVPANNTGATYTFGTASPLALVAGSVWSVAVPSGTLPVYTSRAVVSAAAGYTSAVTISGWTTPVISLENGSDGAQGPTVQVITNRAATFESNDDVLLSSTVNTNIVFTARSSGITATSWAWTFYADGKVLPVTVGGVVVDASTCTLTKDQFAAIAPGIKSLKVICKVNDNVNYTDAVTVVRLDNSTAAAGATVGASLYNKYTVTDATNVTAMTTTAGKYRVTYDATTGNLVSAGNFVITASSLNVLTTSVAHGFTAGEQVRFSFTGTTISGITSGVAYYVASPSGATLKLSTSAANALAATPLVITLGALTAGSTYSIEAYNWLYSGYSSTGIAVASGAKVTWTMTAFTGSFTIGLNTNPSLDSSYTSIDFCIFISGSQYSVVESSVNKGSFGVCLIGDTFAIIYNHAAARVDYYCSGVHFYSTILSAALVSPLYVDTSLIESGTTIYNIGFSGYLLPSPVSSGNLLGKIHPGNASTYIANAAIQTALIGDAQITTAKIVDLAVDTLQIKGNAVTVPTSFSAPAIDVYANTTHDVISQPFTSNGYPSIITASVQLTAALSGYCVVNSNVIWAAGGIISMQILIDGVAQLSPAAILLSSSSLSIRTTLAVGSHTLIVRLSSSCQVGRLNYTSVQKTVAIIMETKR
jgi:hypothetical protein